MQYEGCMECLVKFLDTALTRSIGVVDGMGYGPTNLPLSSPVRTNRIDPGLVPVRAMDGQRGVISRRERDYA